MPAFKLEKFGGMLPAWDDRLLPNDQAALSRDAYLYSGALIGWRRPKLLRALNSGTSKFAFRVPQFTKAFASANLVFLLNAVEGDTVKVGEEVYKFTATVTNPYDVLLGGSATVSATNLFEAFTLTGTAGTTYGTGTCANPIIDATDTTQGTHDFGSGAIPWIFVQAPDFGSAFNATPVTESTGNIRLAWLYDLVSLSDTTTTFTGGANEVANTAIDSSSYWLEFDDKDTDVLRSPVTDDQFGRYYFASPSKQPQYNTYDRIANGDPPWLLGVPAPGCAPTITATGGGSFGTIGLPDQGTGTNTPAGANEIFLLPVTPDGAMQLDSMNLSPANTRPSAFFRAVVYNDNGSNAPGTLLNKGHGVTGCVADTPVNDEFQIPSGLLSGVKYWIGFQCNDAALSVHKADADTNGVKFALTPGDDPPATAPAVTTGQPDWQMWGIVQTSEVLTARAYVYTWVTAYSEEGPPSPPTVVTAWTNSTWAIGTWTPAADEMGVTRNITKVRIYRSVTGNTDTTYFFVAEQDVSDTTYTDTSADNDIVTNNQVASTLWQPPPETLKGFVQMPNGIIAGFKANEIWFCEQYRPHAWPATYVLTTEFPIVGLGVAGQSVVAATEGYPVICSGINPSVMAETKVRMPEPCISRGSIISTDTGVYYASVNGLVFVDQNGAASNATEGWITRERWHELTPAKFIRAVKQASSYFAFGSVEDGDNTYAQQGFTIEMAPDAQSFTIWPQPGGHRLGFGTLTAPGNLDVVNTMVDPWTGYVLVIQNGSLYYYDFRDQAPEIIPYKWRSKKMQQTSKHNFAVMRVFFDIPPGTPTQNPTRQTSNGMTLNTDMYGIVRVYADDTLVVARELRKSGELLRIPSGFKAEFWQWEIEARVKIANLQAATSVKELASV